MTPAPFPVVLSWLEIISINIKPREMREDFQAQSLHYFNSYAVKDWLSTAGLEDHPCLPDFDSFDMEKILPTSGDHETIESNFCVLIGRVLKKHFKFFSKFATGITKPIKRQHYGKMSQKSEVVNKVNTRFYTIIVLIYRVPSLIALQYRVFIRCTVYCIV